MRRLFLLGCLWLVGCTTLPEGPLGERNYQSTISVGGRLSVRYQQSGQPQSLQGKFRWQQQGEQTNITLYSPLGQTIATIAITSGLAVMTQSDGEKRQAPNVTALTQEVLGWPMPVDGLRYWLQGFVQNTNGQLDAASPEGRNSFQSSGWHVRYVSWQRNASIQYPKRFDMERTTAEAGDIVLRLVIDDWNDR
jgi:outer membrane lipoprotein LolB